LAMEKFEVLSNQYDKKDIAFLSRFERVECMYKMGDYITSLDSYKRFLKDSEYTRYKDFAVYRIAYIELKQGYPKDARKTFALISDKSNLFKLSSGMIEKTTDYENLKRKTPALAGIMSAIIPGTGQFYNGKIKDGIVALLTNGLFIWGTYELYRRKIYGIAAVATVFTAGWYSGNVFGAVSGAHKYNHKREVDFFEDLKPNYEDIDPKDYRN